MCAFLFLTSAAKLQAPDDLPYVRRKSPPKLTTPTLLLMAEPGTKRTEELMRILLTRYDSITLRDPGTPLGEGDKVVHVIDGVPNERLISVHSSYNKLPYEEPSGRSHLGSVVLIGKSIHLAAETYGLLGIHGGGKLPLSSPAVWTGAPPSLAATKALDEVPGLGWSLGPFPSEILGGVRPPLLSELMGSPQVGISVISRDSADREVALLWHQGRFVSFVPGGPIESLGPVWSELLLESVSLADGFLQYSSPSGDPAVSNRDRTHFSPGVERDLLQVGVEPSSPEFLPTLVDGLRAKTLDERLRARRLLEEFTPVPLGYSWTALPKPGASAARWSEYLAEYSTRIFYSSRNRTWNRDPLAGPAHGESRDLSAIERATKGYEPLDAEAGLIATPAAFSVALAKCSTEAERGRLLARVRFEHGGEETSLELLSLARAEPSYRMRRPLNSIYALALRRLGPSGFDALCELAGERRPFADALSSLAEQVDDGKLDELYAVPGELVEAFRGMAWHIESDEQFFTKCTQRLEFLVGEILVRAKALDFFGSPWLEDARCMAFELVAALEVGRTRQMLDEESWTTLENLARRVTNSSARFLASGVLADELIALLQGERDKLGLELTRVRVERWNELFSSNRQYHYQGNNYSDFGFEGIVEALEHADSKPPWEFELPELLFEEPQHLDSLLRTRGAPRLALRAITILRDVRAIAPLLRSESFPSSLSQRDSLWVLRRAAFSVCSPYLDIRPVVGDLLRLLESEDSWLRAFACRALREPRGKLDGQELEVFAELKYGSDEPLAVLAQDTLRYRTAPTGWRLSALLANPQVFEQVGKTELDDSRAWLQLEAGEQAQRAEAAYFLAASEGNRLLGELSRGDAAAREQVMRIEHELGADVRKLCAWMDLEMFRGPATTRLTGYRTLALPEFEWELMYPYRFPIGGRATYEELKQCILAMGADAWPIYISSLFHWRGHGFGDIAPHEASFEGKQDIVAPFFAMGFARDVALGPIDSEFKFERDGTPSESYVQLWQNLGAPGETALRELLTYPDEKVRTASRVMLDSL